MLTHANLDNNWNVKLPLRASKFRIMSSRAEISRKKGTKRRSERKTCVAMTSFLVITMDLRDGSLNTFTTQFYLFIWSQLTQPLSLVMAQPSSPGKRKCDLNLTRIYAQLELIVFALIFNYEENVSCISLGLVKIFQIHTKFYPNPTKTLYPRVQALSNNHHSPGRNLQLQSVSFETPSTLPHWCRDHRELQTPHRYQGVWCKLHWLCFLPCNYTISWN